MKGFRLPKKHNHKHDDVGKITVISEEKNLTVEPAPFKYPVEIGNLIISIIRRTPMEKGIVGETYIHLILYRLLQEPAFSDLSEKYPFGLDEGRPYSKKVHTAIKQLSKDISNFIRSGDEKFGPAIIIDRVRENYDEIRNAESWLEKHVGEPVYPSIFMLTPNGVFAEEITWNKLFNEEQKKVIHDVLADLLPS